MPATRIQITSYILNIASNRTFNEWKGNIYLYRQNGTVAVDLRFVDNPDSFSQYESVNPQGCSQIYASFTQYLIYVEMLEGSHSIYAILYQNASAGFAKMILQVIPAASTLAVNLLSEHRIDLNISKKVSQKPRSKTKVTKKRLK